MRFIKDEVNPIYLHATVNDIIAPSKYIQNIEGYDNIDIADATTWITPELQKQRMKGFGQWTPAVEEAYERLMA
jgi:elongation factor P hydroxylase